MTKDKSNTLEVSEGASSNSSPPVDQELEFITGKEGIITLSNEDPNQDKLDFLLNDGFPISGGNASPSGARSPNQMSMDDVKVDVTLRPLLDKPPVLMLLITDPGQDAEQPLREPVQVTICFEIGLNGRISVVETSGLLERSDAGKDDAEMQMADAPRPGLQDIQRKIAKVLEISQDLGILVEWVLRWLRQRDSSG